MTEQVAKPESSVTVRIFLFGAVSSKKRYLPTAPFSTINLCGKMYLITEDGEVEKELAIACREKQK